MVARLPRDISTSPTAEKRPVKRGCADMFLIIYLYCFNGNRYFQFVWNSSVHIILKLFAALTSLAFILILTSCTVTDEYKGVLVLDGSSNFQSKTLLPDINMTPAGYDITGLGPGGANFSFTDSQLPVFIPDLDTGVWTITVDAKNESGIVIGMGEETTILSMGQTQTIHINISPVEGYGAIDITVNWSAEDTYNPSVTAQLVPDFGPFIDLAFVIEPEGTASFSANDIPTGYHTLVVQLLDNGILTMGTVEVVRVVKDAITAGQYEFYEINKLSANLSDDVVNDLTVDSAGNVYVTGFIQDNNKKGALYSFEPDGTLRWSQQVGSKDSVLNGVAVDIGNPADPDDDAIFVVGYDTDFVSGSSGKDWLIRKYSSVDGSIISASSWPGRGGDGEDVANDVAVDTAGNVYVSGVMEGSTKDWTTYSFEPDGTLRWSRQLGSKDGVLNGVAVDKGNPADPADDTIYAVGYYTNFVGASTGRDWLIRKYSSVDGSIISAASWPGRGGAGEDIAYDVAVDSSGNVFVAGVMEGSTKDWTTYSFGPDGTLRWSQQMGSKDGVLNAIAVDPADDSVYVAGYYEFTPGNKDWLIRKYANTGGDNIESWRLPGFGGTGEDIANNVTVDPLNGRVYISGYGTDLINGLSRKDAWLKGFSLSAVQELDIKPFR